MKIKVTSEDIIKGIRNIANKCPVARAVSREVGKKCEVYPSGTGELSRSKLKLYTDDYEGRPSNIKSMQLPKEANDFALNFDRLQHVYPFEFELAYEKN